MNFVKSIFSKKDKDNCDKIFVRNIAISIFAMLICVVFLCASSWAWFETNTVNAANTVQAGNFDLEINITDSAESPVDLTSSDSVYILNAVGGEVYTVVVRASDDSTVSGGYCALLIDGTYYRTDYFTVGESFSFTLSSSSSVAITFTPVWGSPSEVAIENGDTFTIE